MMVKPKLLDQVRNATRVRHLSPVETRRFEFPLLGRVAAGKPIEAVEDVDVEEKQCGTSACQRGNEVHCCQACLRYAKDMGRKEIEEFLTDLAVKGNVIAREA